MGAGEKGRGRGTRKQARALLSVDPGPAGADQASDAPVHVPVMLDEVLEALAPEDGDTIIDATFGAGGYTRAILAAADCRVIALDRDPSAIAAGRPLAAECGHRLQLVATPFSALSAWAEARADRGATSDPPAQVADPLPGRVRGIVFDLGVSSMHLDRPERGFSFQADGPLDMRMFAACGETTEDLPSAREIVNEASEAELADILYHYGDERRARTIARAIAEARATAPIETTRELASIVQRTVGRGGADKKHPATRTFQALRIAVNREFDELVEGLAGAERLLAPGGRLVVVAFHSIEDRIVKRFLGARCGKSASAPRHMPETVALRDPSFRFVNPKPLTASNEELARNPRARSATLRSAIRTHAVAWPLERDSLGAPRVEGAGEERQGATVRSRRRRSGSRG
ncbi:MAG: 16S rRNA (cytosine(1402)-N(4))-methyltransferase RsmH [Hyphomicrobiaceae bacterium]